MKEISDKINNLDDELLKSWSSIKPSYLHLWFRNIFEIETDIFFEIEYIIGNRKF